MTEIGWPDDPQRGVQWFTFAGTVEDLIRQDGLTTAGLRWVRSELLDGGWRQESLPAGACWRARLDLLELVDGALAAGDAVMLAHYRHVDGLAAPDDLGAVTP